MRTFTLFLGLMAASLAAIAALSYPAWLVLHPHFDFPFHRIGERVGMLAFLVGFVLVARRARLANRQSLGYGLPRGRFLRELALGLLIGVLTMLLVVGAMAALGLLAPSDRMPTTAAAVVRLILARLLSGLAVAFIEETFLRGAMFTGIERESGTLPAILLTSLVYSITHFFASYHIPADQVTASSGLALLGGTLHLFGQPLAIADAFACLFAVGVVLATIRAVTGNIAAGVGLHAGWVWVMLTAHAMSRPVHDHPLGFLLSQFDGFVGWLVLAWTLIFGVVLRMFYLRRTRRASFE